MANEVFIDSGHGGSDPGAVGNGVIERDKNLALAKYIITRLKAHGLTIRSDLDIGNPGSGGSVPYSRKFPNVKLFYSQHHNAASATARGYEIYKTGTGRSLRFAKAVHTRQLAALRAMDATIPDRKVKEAIGTRAEYIVTRSQGAACLSEALFVSNVADAAIAKRSDYVARIGEATVRAIVEFGKAEGLWSTLYKPGTAPLPTYPNWVVRHRDGNFGVFRPAAPGQSAFPAAWKRAQEIAVGGERWVLVHQEGRG